MFYLTRNFERQKLRLRKAKKNYNADADADVNANADAERCRCRDFQMALYKAASGNGKSNLSICQYHE